HRTRRHGDLLAVYTWLGEERALVLIPALRRGAAWFVVAESAAFAICNCVRNTPGSRWNSPSARASRRWPCAIRAGRRPRLARVVWKPACPGRG
ncbi:MAG: hypothetical protein FJY39_10870, partial [Betaproteobacteria bacterium]|nr:hypothetical protein [Betaproteobacteria bacterium]